MFARNVVIPGSFSVANEMRRVDEHASNHSATARAVFVSHSSQDHQLGEELCAALEARGFACWMAPRDVTPGQPWALGVVQGVAQSSSLLLLASESALASPQVLSEVEQAHKRGKPIYTILIPPARVRGEMDFYLSRLHWIESGGRTAETIAEKLAPVLAKRREWAEVASPPGLRRTVRYRPAAFAKLVAGVMVGLALVLGSILFALNRTLNRDFRRLGYVTFAAEQSNGGRLVGQVRVWLLAEGVPFAKVRLLTVTSTVDAQVSRRQYSDWPVPEQVGSQQVLALPLEASTRQVTTCLVIPASGDGPVYRVTQRFLLTVASDGIRVSEIAPKRVTKENGSPCG
jgi:hypothetical protein